ncbi:MAG: polysaccharide deacetylase family protein [Peptostreptococcus sp.]|nr:polysaccharide deacetylase family protein [Peptostreptococcus sp.]
MIVLKILLGLLAVFFVHSIVPTYYNKLFNKRVVKEVDGDKNIMLTFDDGPDRRYIYDLMDLLDRHDVKAIFFMVGENAEKNKDIVKELVDRGHRVGMHSWQHKNAMLYS